MKQSLDVERTGHGRFGKSKLQMYALNMKRILFFLIVALLTYFQVCQHGLWDWPTRR